MVCYALLANLLQASVLLCQSHSGRFLPKAAARRERHEDRDEDEPPGLSKRPLRAGRRGVELC